MNATTALGWALLHFLWQGTLLALAARLVLALLPRRRAEARYAVAVAALALMPVAVAASFVRARGAPATVELAEARAERAEDPDASAPHDVEAVPAATGPRNALESLAAAAAGPVAAVQAAAGPSAWKQRVDRALPWIVGAWALGVLALALRLLLGYAATRRLVRARGEPVPEAVSALLARLAARLGVRRAVRVCSSRLTDVPAVAGWLAPVVLLPASALTGLARAELEAILAHELAHVKRHDYLVNLLQTLIETLLFYHPAVWWLGARIRAEREHRCDDLAVAACGSAPLYAEALLTMERLRGAPALALGLTGGSLAARVERLLAPRTPELFPRWIAGMSAAAIVVLLVATADLAVANPASAASERQREPARAAQVPTGAGEVRVHPGPEQDLARRNEWAHAEAARRRQEEFWIGHAIAPLAAFEGGILMGRFDHAGGLVLDDGDNNLTLMGRIVSTRSLGGLQLPGVPLAPLVQADPADVAVLYLWSARGSRPSIRRVHLATAALAVDLEGLPLFWLGRADDRASVADALAGMERASDAEVRRDLVGIVGAHGSSELVVPELRRILAPATRDEELRAEAAEWLAYHPVMEALGALAGAARGDDAEKVRCEAAEAVGEMRFAPAFDVLVALAHELQDRNARLEAVEGLGMRSEPGAVAALLDLANGDADEDVQREAAETLGDVPDHAGLSAVAALARSHPSLDVRGEAIETYGECAPTDEAIAFLRDLAERDPAIDARREAVETLGELHDERVVEILVMLVERSDEPEVQREAVETLGATVAGAAVAPALERIARRHPVLDVQREAVETLGELHDGSNAVLDVVAALAADHPSEEVRGEAVETLADHGSPASLAALFERLLASERSPHVRAELKEALSDLAEDDESDD